MTRNDYTHTTWDTRSWNTGAAIGRRWSRNWTSGNQLQQAIFAAQELTGNLLYELMVVQKMDYQPRGRSRRGNGRFSRTRKTSPSYRSIQRPSTRTNPCPRSPHNRRSRHRRGQPEAKSPSQSRRHSHAESHRSRKPPGNARGKSCAREVHRMGRDAECVCSGPAARLAKRRQRIEEMR